MKLKKLLKRRILLVSITVWFAYVQILLPTRILAEEITPSTPSASVETGDAYATTESLDITNTTTINSQIAVTQGDIIDPAGDVPLFQTLATTPSAQTQEDEALLATTSGELDIANTVEATTSAETKVETGGNTQISSESASMVTGEAVATSYATLIENTTLVNSSLEIAQLTLLKPWDGNLILKPLTSQERNNLLAVVGNLYLSNSGEVITEANAIASTGENSQFSNGQAMLETGSGMSSASSNALVNTTLTDAILFDFFVHNLSLWSGQVYNWLQPGTRSNPEELVGRHLINTEESCNGGSLDVNIKNNAVVTTSATAIASTGENHQSASNSAGLTTGNAFASAKATSVVNTTLINSKYRLIDLTLFAPWTGNLIFAYPDLVVTIDAPMEVVRGDPINYTVTIANIGYDNDTGIVLNTNNNSSQIGSLNSAQSVSRTFVITTNENTASPLSLQATAGGDLEEESLANNSDSATVMIRERETNANERSNSTSAESKETPFLSLTASNNINEFIYPGDTTRYEAVITNNGPGKAYDNVFKNTFYNSQGAAIGTIQALVGHLGVGEKKLIRFNLATSSSLTPGTYYTSSIVAGRSDNLETITSNGVINNVPIRGRSVALGNSQNIGESNNITPEVLAYTGQVLGTENKHCATCRYANLLLIIMTALEGLYTYEGRRHQSKRLLNMSLGWGILGYIALILLNPDCANGLTIVSGSFLCKYFLPIVVTEALLLRALTTQKTLRLGRVFALTRKMSRQ